ncbi:putative protein TPRXL [Aplysia californica]|uniref:ETS domain-containing protein n=1 Tax=Aplysia californica TaxID=6500 RepID=A0ABM1ABF4_APLCA|nr:putative protein TPRXL [Aplysia californica]
MSSRSTPPSSSSSSSLSSSFTSRRPSHAGSTTSTKSPSSSASQLLSSTSSSSLLPSSSPSPSSSLSISMCVNVTRNPSSSSSSSSLSSSCRMDVMDSGYISDDSMHGPSYLPPPPGSEGPHHLYPGCPPGSDVMSKPAGNAMSMGHMTSAYACAAGVPGEQRKKPAKKHRSNAAKNNHLWEFVRDLLHDPKTNPKLLTWEDEERGVFRFVQSDKVAELWGEKKNNKEMTYEKLSRAMRFCRSAGYFAFVPKNERFPKKLCFMFGHKAHGWKQ